MSAQADRMVATVIAAGSRCGAVTCEQACETGDAKACAWAAELSWDGQYGHAFDPAAALGYARRGCDGGDALACTRLGRHLVSGVATPWAPAAALVVFEKACQDGSGLGCLALGNMYAQGHGVDVDPEKADTYRSRAQRTFKDQCSGNEPRWCTYVHHPKGSDAGEELAERACASGAPTGCVQVLLARIKDGQHTGTLDAIDRMCNAGERTACVASADLVTRARLPGAAATAQARLTRACELGDPAGCERAGLAAQAAASTPSETERRYFERGCALASGRSCLQLAEDALLHGRAAQAAAHGQRACELGEEAGCEMMQRNHLEQRDDEGADRWAREGCRRGASYGCERLVERDLALPWLRGGEIKRLYRRGCGSGHASACRKLADLARAEEPVLVALRDAVTQGDTAAFARLIPGEHLLHGLWFADVDCATRLGGAGPLTEPRRADLRKCLADHGLRLESKAGMDGGAVLVIDPGVVLDLRITGGKIEQISMPPRSPVLRDAAPVDWEALASHLVAGSLTVEPPRDVRAAVAAVPGGRAGVELTVCVGPSGNVAASHAAPARGGSAHESYVRAVEHLASQWRFQPFTVHGKPIPVCARNVFAYPADRRRELMLASTVGTARRDLRVPPNVAPTALDANRIAGQKNIVPDDETKNEIAGSGRSKLVGSFKLCVDATGRVTSVTRLKSTGFPAYDHKIETTIRTWRYRPMWIDGRPADVCTAVTFIYSQR